MEITSPNQITLLIPTIQTSQKNSIPKDISGERTLFQKDNSASNFIPGAENLAALNFLLEIQCHSVQSALEYISSYISIWWKYRIVTLTEPQFEIAVSVTASDIVLLFMDFVSKIKAYDLTQAEESKKILNIQNPQQGKKNFATFLSQTNGPWWNSEQNTSNSMNYMTLEPTIRFSKLLPIIPTTPTASLPSVNFYDLLQERDQTKLLKIQEENSTSQEVVTFVRERLLELEVESLVQNQDLPSLYFMHFKLSSTKESATFQMFSLLRTIEDRIQELEILRLNQNNDLVDLMKQKTEIQEKGHFFQLQKIIPLIHNRMAFLIINNQNLDLDLLKNIQENKNLNDPYLASLLALKIDQKKLRSLTEKILAKPNENESIVELRNYLQVSPIAQTSSICNPVVPSSSPSSTSDLQVKLLSINHSKQLQTKMKQSSSKLPSSWEKLPTRDTPETQELMAAFISNSSHEVGLFFFKEVENDFSSFLVPYFVIDPLSLFRDSLTAMIAQFKDYAQFYLPADYSGTSFSIHVALTFLKDPDNSFDVELTNLGFELSNTNNTRVWKFTSKFEIENINPFQKINQYRVYFAAKGARGKLLTDE